MSGLYESTPLLGQYLLLHYGQPGEVLPWKGGPVEALGFPARCAERLGRERGRSGRPTERFLDLGCAVGRSTFEGTRWAGEAMGLDYSASFIESAARLAREGRMPYLRTDEGERTTELWAEVPPELDRTRVRFLRGDACGLDAGLGPFDAVLLANLLCRLPDPAACLVSLSGLVGPGGTVMITTPCSWMEEFTPKTAWLGGKDVPTLEGIRCHLEKHFELQSVEEMPFLIREHARKFQWSMAQASLWERKVPGF
jgi:putative 4-mercaptohistidine N1-methyltranferase